MTSIIIICPWYVGGAKSSGGRVQCKVCWDKQSIDMMNKCSINTSVNGLLWVVAPVIEVYGTRLRVYDVMYQTSVPSQVPRPSTRCRHDILISVSDYLRALCAHWLVSIYSIATCCIKRACDVIIHTSLYWRHRSRHLTVDPFMWNRSACVPPEDKLARPLPVELLHTERQTECLLLIC